MVTHMHAPYRRCTDLIIKFSHGQINCQIKTKNDQTFKENVWTTVLNEALLKVQNPRCNDSMLAEFACTGTLASNQALPLREIFNSRVRRGRAWYILITCWTWFSISGQLRLRTAATYAGYRAMTQQFSLAINTRQYPATIDR